MADNSEVVLYNGNRYITGHYFTYCQLCKHDGNCELKHYEVLGMRSSGKIDKTPYPGHENLRWHFSFLQTGTIRGMCAGRIIATISPFYPLACACGTVINGSNCQKFEPNEEGLKRKKVAHEILARRGIPESDDITELTMQEMGELNDCCPINEEYIAEIETYFADYDEDDVEDSNEAEGEEEIIDERIIICEFQLQLF